jgi:quercetin dioxygenase-like cupin family protein/DNA-binding XRE family transcriptional regulator
MTILKQRSFKDAVSPVKGNASRVLRDSTAIVEAQPPAHSSFGEKLRFYRESRNLSLKDLAEKAGISVGILSQVERGINSPSLRTLSKVRTALGLPSSFFFDDDHPPVTGSDEPDFVCRVADRPQLFLGPGAPHKELLHHGTPRVFEFMTIELPPRYESGTSSYPSEKGGYVLEGEVIMTVGDKTVTLHPGDSFLFDGIKPHTLTNPTDKVSKLLWIIAKLPNDLLL